MESECTLPFGLIYNEKNCGGINPSNQISRVKFCAKVLVFTQVQTHGKYLSVLRTCQTGGGMLVNLLVVLIHVGEVYWRGSLVIRISYASCSTSHEDRIPNYVAISATAFNG